MISTSAITMAAVAFAVNLLTSIVKKYVYPRYGKVGVQFVAFALAFIGAWYFIYGQQIESLSKFVVSALGIFSMSVTFYEVILQNLPWFKSKGASTGATE